MKYVLLDPMMRSTGGLADMGGVYQGLGGANPPHDDFI